MTSPLVFHPPVIGHRGACAYAPENTMSSFLKAAQLGVKWVEFDIMQSACGQPIVFHDETLDRTTQSKGDVSLYPYSYLQTLDAGYWFNSRFAGERIPTLTQVMDFLIDAKMNANIEIKAPLGHEEALVVRALKELGPYLAQTSSTILFSSFSVEALQYLRQYSPHSLIGLLMHEWDPEWRKICKTLQCVSVHVNEEIMTHEAAKEIKDIDKMLLCYTVNDPIRAKTLCGWGVDAVFSDRPDKLLK